MKTQTSKILLTVLLSCLILLILSGSVGAQDQSLPLPRDLQSNYTRASGAFQEQQKFSAGDWSVADQFGYSISVSGDTVLIGAYEGHNDDSINHPFEEDYVDADQILNTGNAYVYVKDETGNWVHQMKLAASDGDIFESFGYSVSLSGDTALIGAPYKGTGGGAYVFVRDGSGNWTEQKKFVPLDNASSDHFGWSVAVDGDTAIVGAIYDAPGGSAYVFVRDGSGNWTQQDKLIAADIATDDSFGYEVSVSGDTALIGSRDSAYVFVRDGSGNWTQQDKLVAADGGSGAGFGGAVSLDGDTALIGASADSGNSDGSGSAYVFTRSNGNWTQQAKLLPGSGDLYGGFGESVSLDGDTALIGALTSNELKGGAYIFTRSNGSWTQQQELTASDGVTDDIFGEAVALDGDNAFIGAPRYSDLYDDEWRGYVYFFAAEPKLNVELSSAAVTVEEGDSGSNNSGLSLLVSGGIAYQSHTVELVVTGGTASSTEDYSQSSTTISIIGGNYLTPQTISLYGLVVNGDNLFEADETIFVALQNPDANTIVGDANGDSTTQASSIVTITDDDNPIITVSNTASNEGDSGTKDVTFSAKANKGFGSSFTVDYATSDGTAIAGEDYIATSGTLTFAGTVNETQTFTVSINGDTEIESNETFFVTLSNPSSSDITVDDTATGTIFNDDAKVEVLIDGGFEGEKKQGVPVAWSGKLTSIPGKDKQKCNKPDKIIAYSGDCAFLFKGNATGDKSKINQKIEDLSLFVHGMNATLSVYVDKRSATVNHPIGKLIVKYSNGGKNKLILRIPDADGYTLISDSVIIDLNGRSLELVKVQFRNRMTSGKFFLDDASLTVTPLATLRAERDILPLPEVPNGFRD